MNAQRPTILFAAVLLTVALGADDAPRPELARLKAHVATLASPEFGGRHGDGARKAEAYLAEEFKSLKLKPLFDGSYAQDVPGKEPGEVVGRNLGGVIEGTDPALKDQYVILSAHYDHLGVRNGVLYPGADDNASSVAMMLEVARSIVEGGEKPKRSVMFVAFDLEEDGLWGSRYFVQHPPVPLDRIALFMTADLLGRSLGGQTAFVVGLPEKDIGRLGYLNCRYGLPDASAGAVAKAEIGVSLYKDAQAAAARIPATVDDYVAHGASSSTTQVDGQSATILTGGTGAGYTDPTLVLASGQRTVAVSMHESAGAQATKDLTALAHLALTQTGG